jgi:hypothetical protein
VRFPLRKERRRVVHFNITTAPTAAWVARQQREAFPSETAPLDLTRDRDGIYGEEVRRCLAGLCIEGVVTAPRLPSCAARRYLAQDCFLVAFLVLGREAGCLSRRG